MPFSLGQTEEQRQRSFQDAGLTPEQQERVIKGISSADLQPKDPLVIPPPQQNRGVQDFQAIINAATQQFSQPVKEEVQGADLQTRILSSLDRLSTRSTARQRAEGTAGLPALQQQLTDVTGQLGALQREAAAIPLQIQEEFTGRGATAAGVEPIQIGRLRENAIKSLQLASTAQILQGNVALAQQQVDRAVDLEFEPLENELRTLGQIYQFNKDALERSDKKRADVLQLVLGERNRLLAESKADKEAIYDLALRASKYGVSQNVIKDIQAAKTPRDALAVATPYMTDPAQKLELESVRLENALKKAQIAKVERETSLLGEPTEAEKKASASALKEAQASMPVMQDKIDAVDVLKTHTGFNTRVGPSFLGRTGLLGIRGLADRLGGAGQDFAGGIHKLVGGLTLDNLIAAKARGATFGALSEGELSILASSATAINDWEIKDKNGRGTGFWNIDERSFNAELDTIKRLTQRALQQSQGSIFTKEEQGLLDALDETNASENPALYFPNN